MLIRNTLTRRANAALLLFLLLGLPCLASADGISGYLEYNYGTSKTNSTDVTGSTRQNSSNFSQRYNLEIDKSLTSTIRLSMGANTQLNTGDSEINDLSSLDGQTKSHSTSSRISPHIDLGYANGFFNGGASFSRRMEDSKSNGVATPTTYADSYSTRLSWIPEDFPSVNLIYSSFDRYDETRLSQDSNTTSLTLSSRYKPLQTLDLSYSGNNSTTTNHLSGFETKSLTQSLRADYNDVFLKDRVVVSSSYNISTQNTTATNNGSSSSQLVLNPVNSIFKYFLAPTKTSNDSTLTPDFNDPAVTLSSTSNLPATVFTLPTASDARTNLGINVGYNNPVNLIRLLVNTTTSNQADLTLNGHENDYNAIYLGFTSNSNVKVYSSDNGRDWKELLGSAIAFNRFTSPATNQLVLAFELQLPNPANIGTGYPYIKIEIGPVKTINLPDSAGTLQTLTITKLEAYFQDQNTIIKPGSSRSSSQISGAYNLNLRARLWDVPTVTFDSGFDLQHTKSDSTQFAYRYSLSNGLSLYHILSPTLSTSGRLSRQDSVNPSDNTRDSSSSLSLSLAATPLPTLSGTLNYSARLDTSDTTSKTSQSLSMSSTAELYRNINLGLNINGSMSSDNTGKQQQGVTTSMGLNMVPHRTVSINIGTSDQEGWASGGDTRPETSRTYNRSIDTTITYNPLQSIYLYGTMSIVTQSQQKTQTTQSVGGSWSPFRDGALQLNISYREAIQADSTKDKTFTNSAHLTIRPGMFLDISYLKASSTGVTQKNDVQSLSSSFRASF